MGLRARDSVASIGKICELSGVKRFHNAVLTHTAFCNADCRLFPGKPGSSVTGKSSIDDARYDIRTRND